MKGENKMNNLVRLATMCCTRPKREKIAVSSPVRTRIESETSLAPQIFQKDILSEIMSFQDRIDRKNTTSITTESKESIIRMSIILAEKFFHQLYASKSYEEYKTNLQNINEKLNELDEKNIINRRLIEKQITLIEKEMRISFNDFIHSEYMSQEEGEQYIKFCKLRGRSDSDYDMNSDLFFRINFK